MRKVILRMRDSVKKDTTNFDRDLVPGFMLENKQEIRPTKLVVAVLDVLAHNGPMSRWDIKQKRRRHYSQVHTTVKQLEESGLVNVVKNVESKRGLQKDIYGLTIYGIIFVSRFQQKLRKFRYVPRVTKQIPEFNIDLIAQNHAKSLPLIFGKWNYFNKEGVLELAKLYFENAALATWNPSLDEDKWSNFFMAQGLQAETPNSEDRRFIWYWYMLHFHFYKPWKASLRIHKYVTEEDEKKWVSMVKGDSEIKRLVEEICIGLREFEQRQIKSLEDFQSLLDK